LLLANQLISAKINSSTYSVRDKLPAGDHVVIVGEISESFLLLRRAADVD
jgi:hypothetical protein